MENPNYYAIIPAKVRYDNELKGNEKLLYGEMTALANKEGYCTATNTYFSKLYAKHKDTIQEWISKLKSKGYIETQLIKNDLGRVEERRIYPVGENTYTYRQKHTHPIGKNALGNNTSINNKNKKKEELKKVIEFYEDNIALITPFVAEDMEKYLENGLQTDLIIACMEEAVSRNKRNWHYVVSILNNCCNSKITTAKQFKISQKEFKSNKNQTTKKDKTEEKIEYEEIEYENEEDYKKKILEKG